jgi:FkbM family methyltransferase
MGLQGRWSFIHMENKIKELFTVTADTIIYGKDKEIEKILQSYQHRFVLVGAGELGLATLTGLQKQGIEPECFSDDNPKLWHTTINGIKVLSFQEAIHTFSNNAIFVVTIYNSNSIVEFLTKLDIQTLTFADLSWYYRGTFLPYYFLDTPINRFDDYGKKLQLMLLWADDKSKQEYLDQLNIRINNVPNTVPVNPVDDIYFPRDIVDLQNHEIFIDCGAYTGDTVSEFIERSSTFDKIVSIEPDTKNYELLLNYVSNLPSQYKNKILTRKIALSSEKDKIPFRELGDATSFIGGDTLVDSDTLDNLITDSTYIKMDIEGAELDALMGAEKTILRDRPVMAICLYHRPEHLWKIPLFLHYLVPSYKLFLRAYAENGWDLVCYAVPPSRVKEVK